MVVFTFILFIVIKCFYAIEYLNKCTLIISYEVLKILGKGKGVLEKYESTFINYEIVSFKAWYYYNIHFFYNKLGIVVKLKITK